MLNDFQKGIGSIVFQPFHSRGRVEEGNAFLVEKCNDFIHFEAFAFCVNEMVFVIEPDLAFNAPVVVDEIGIEKVHAPTLLGWWKTAKEQHFGIGGQKWFQWMVFDHN